MDTEIQRLKKKIAEYKSLTSLSAQRNLEQMLSRERRKTLKPLKDRQIVLDRIKKRWNDGHLALDLKTIKMLNEVT
jgi:hypothetical protein